eukprot:scaffold482_cov247-Pinguiococcus_pyrenoidosus.AAC.28
MVRCGVGTFVERGGCCVERRGCSRTWRLLLRAREMFRASVLLFRYSSGEKFFAGIIPLSKPARLVHPNVFVGILLLSFARIILKLGQSKANDEWFLDPRQDRIFSSSSLTSGFKNRRIAHGVTVQTRRGGVFRANET